MQAPEFQHALLEVLYQLDNLPPGLPLDVARMSPAANFAHVLLCIQHGKDNDFAEWFNRGRNHLEGLVDENASTVESADRDDSGFFEGSNDEAEEAV